MNVKSTRLGLGVLLPKERNQLCAQARDLVQKEPFYQGRRHWEKDPSRMQCRFLYMAGMPAIPMKKQGPGRVVIPIEK